MHASTLIIYNICISRAVSLLLDDPTIIELKHARADYGQVYRLSIGAACGLSWPSDRLVIQVLDDSTDPAIRQLVEVEIGRAHV